MTIKDTSAGNLAISNPANVSKGYYQSPWPGEDGGPERLQVITGQPGLNIQPGETLKKTASRRLCTGNMVVLRDPGEVYLMHVDTLRDRIGIACNSHVEKLDPETLKPIKRSPPLTGGTWWPGGVCVHRNGDLYASFGRYMHRLNPDCELVASYKLPQNLPYNSHVVLDNGYIVTKPIEANTSTALVVLDPETLTPACADTLMPEPSISRLSSHGNTVYVAGVRTIYRYTFDEITKTLSFDETWSLDYVGDTIQEYGWDPVISGKNIWFMDNGKHTMGRTSLSMINAGVMPTPNNIIRVAIDDSSNYSISPICGINYGSVTNPPLHCPRRNILVAYDSSNSVVQAWRHNTETEELTKLWKLEGFGMGGHTIYYPDTGEIITADYQSLKTWNGLTNGESSVVLDIETGQEKARTPMGNYMQSCCFPAPGFGRDYYWLGLDKLTYIRIE